MRVIRRHFLAAAWTQLSASPRTVLFRWKSVVDHVDHAAPRAPRRWTTVRLRKGNDTEPEKIWQLFPTRRGVRGFTGSSIVAGE